MSRQGVKKQLILRLCVDLHLTVICKPGKSLFSFNVRQSIMWDKLGGGVTQGVSVENGCELGLNISGKVCSSNS